MTTHQNDGTLYLIEDREDLLDYLIAGMKIEHATIPPYMTALYSIKPGSNIEAYQIIRSVVVEEMLHLTLVANVFNAVGGNIRSVLTADDFIPQYPTVLPNGETDFKVGLEKFSRRTIETFLQIERVDDIPEDQPLVKPRSQQCLVSPKDDSLSFYSIGQFYAEVIRSLYTLSQEMGEKNLFCGAPQRQITSEYYYDGSGEIVPVYDLRSAIRALRIIQEQGEGSSIERIYDGEKDLAHYYRFQQLELGRYYQIDRDNPDDSDQPNYPRGINLNKEQLDWDAVYPIKANAKLRDYPENCELYHLAKAFQANYQEFLGKIEYAFDGHPEELIPAIGGMFKLKYYAEQIVKNPIPGQEGVNGAPIFRLD